MTISQFRLSKLEELKNSPKLAEQKNFLLDIDCILEHFLKKDRAWILSHDDMDLETVAENASTIDEIETSIEKRKTGLPVAYITGKKEFYGTEFFVNRDVLIPKPDTEILVEKAIELIKTHDFKNIADICTGSGCIGIAVAKNIVGTSDGNCAEGVAGNYTGGSYNFFLTDVSHLALEVAKKNAVEILGEKTTNEKFKFLLGEILWPLIENESEKIRETKFDIILSNPPYIPRLMVNQLLRDGRSEPILALDGDASYTNPLDENYGDGMSVIRPMIPQAFDRLKSGGYFLCETGEYNSDATAELFKSAGFEKIGILKDLEGSPRVVMGAKP